MSGQDIAQEAPVVDWSAVSVESAAAILRQGELYLDGQCRLAIAADQRAMAASSFFSGFAAIVLAATFGYWSQVRGIDLLVAGLVTAALLLAGAVSCVRAAWPVEFAVPGNEPKKWWGVRGEPLNFLLGGQTEHCQFFIEHNHRVLVRNSWWLKAGLVWGVSAPFVGALTWCGMQIMGLFYAFPPA
jgi:hypothetical protein